MYLCNMTTLPPPHLFFCPSALLLLLLLLPSCSCGREPSIVSDTELPSLAHHSIHTACAIAQCVLGSPAHRPPSCSVSPLSHSLLFTYSRHFCCLHISDHSFALVSQLPFKSPRRAWPSIHCAMKRHYGDNDGYDPAAKRSRHVHTQTRVTSSFHCLFNCCHSCLSADHAALSCASSAVTVANDAV